MDKTQLLDMIRAGRARLETTLAQISEARMTQAGVEGEWSVKDALAHITAWEQCMLSWLKAAASGEVPSVPVPGDWDYVHRLNRQTFEENHNRSLPDILADFHRSFQQILQAVEALSDEDLTPPLQAEWAKGESRWDLIAANTYEHYQDHLEPMRVWLSKSS